MTLKPTDVPLSVKDFDKEKCGYCFGCGCHCGFIVYMKEDKIVDVYGHPYDVNSIGSLCNKGIALLGETDQNPLRLRECYIKINEDFKNIDLDEAIAIAKKNINDKMLAILGKFSSLEDYLILKSITSHIYTTGVCLDFNPSSIPPYQWKDIDLIISIEADPVMSEVMSTRWIIDALEKGAYLINISTRYTTLSSKASLNFLLNPYQINEALKSIAEGKGKPWSDILNLIETAKTKLLIVGETILKSPIRETVISFVKYVRSKYNSEYSFIGNVTNVKCKEIKDLEYNNYSAIVSIDNTFYEFDSIPSNTFNIAFSLFPDTTSVNSNLVFPLSLFTEREVHPFFDCFSYGTKSIKIKEPSLKETHEILKDFSREKTKNKFDDSNIIREHRDITDTDYKSFSEVQDDIYIISGESMVEVWGHWYPWLHSMEKYQKAFVSPKTAELMGISENYKFKGIPIEITPLIADGVIFIPEGFEEVQPFNKGIRKGRILNKKGYRIWRYENEY